MKKRLSIRTLSVLFVIAVALPVTLISRLLIFRLIEDPLLRYATEKNLLILDTVRSELENELYHALGILKILEKNPSSFEILKEKFPYLNSFAILDKEGRVREGLPEDRIKRGTSLSKEPFFEEAKIKHIPVFKAPVSLGEERREILLIAPSKDAFSLATIDPLWLKNILTRLELQGFFHFFIVNEEGVPIVHIIDHYVEKGESLRGLKCVNEGLQGKKGPFFEKIEGQDMVTYTSFMPMTGWLLCIGEKKERVFYTYERIKTLLLYSFGISVILSILLGILIAKKITKGIEGLEEAAEAIGRGIYELKPLKPLTREVERVHSILLDMARRVKEKEEELLKEKERLETVIEESPVPTIVLDREGKFLHLNKRFVETFGYTLQDLPDGRTWFRLAYPEKELRDKVISLWKEISKEASYGPIEFPVIRKDGAKRDVRFKSVRAHDLFIVTAEDITEEKEKARNLEIIFNESKDAIFLVDKDGRFLDINRAGLELYGYQSKEEFLKLNIKDISEEESRRRILKELKEKGYVHSFEAVHRRKDGERIFVRDTATAIRDEKGNIVKYLGIVRDVTQLKRLEQQFLQAQKMEIIGRLTGGIAHDMNNMLTVILGNIQLAESLIGKDHPALKYLSRTKEAADRSAGFIKQLLAFSRRQILELKPVNINHIVVDLVKIMRRTIREDIELEVGLSKRDLFVMADIAQINQVLLNLVVNAVEAIEGKGQITIETSSRRIDEEYVREHPEVEKAGEYGLICISDTGSGIPKEILDKIFEPFFTTKKEGTGLGLSVAYGIVKQHGGFINVYSEIGKGTTFKIYLPLMEKKEEEKKEEILIKGGKETILVVEDDEKVGRIAEEMLKRLGYTVFLAKNGEEAIEIFKKEGENIDLCLIDVVMPRMSGRETYEELKKMKEEIRVIFMTGYSENIIHTNFILKENLDFLNKPFTLEVLAKKIRDVLERK